MDIFYIILPWIWTVVLPIIAMLLAVWLLRLKLAKQKVLLLLGATLAASIVAAPLSQIYILLSWLVSIVLTFFAVWLLVKLRPNRALLLTIVYAALAFLINISLAVLLLGLAGGDK